MLSQKLSGLFVTIVILLIFTGCSAPAEIDTPTIAPSSTPSPVPTEALIPTSTTPGSIIDPEKYIGNWKPLNPGRDSMYLQLNPDGTCHQAFTLDGLGDSPQVACTYVLEGQYLLFTSVKLNGVPPCPSETSKYEVQWIDEMQILLEVAEDNCGRRIKSTQGKYERVP